MESPSISFKSRFTYNFPKPTAFLSHYIGSRYAISITKHAKGLYNIKAPNFYQDIGYISFIKDYGDIKEKFDFLKALIRSKHLRNYIVFYIIPADKDNIKLKEVYFSLGKEGSLGNPILLKNLDKIPNLYLNILSKEGYRLERPFTAKRSTYYNNK
jgi:hypothetical protein